MAPCPLLPDSVSRVFEAVSRNLCDGREDPLRMLMVTYRHRVYRCGACQVFPCDSCDARRVREPAVERFVRALFREVAGLCGAEMSRFDLFHAHLFLGRGCGRIGFLFHAKEYPAYEGQLFPYRLGYCQEGSSVVLEECREMGRRCALWMYGDREMVRLDSSTRLPFGTVYESELGAPVADLFYFEGRRGDRDGNLNRGLHIVPYV